MIDDLDELRKFVTISTQITHTDPKAVEGAWFCKQTPNDMNDATWSQTQTEQNVNDVMYELMQNKSLKKGISGYMYHTIPAVMFAYFRYPHQPIKGLQCLIQAGGV